MNSEKIKELWKANAVNEIDNYTDSEITSIVLKSVRKAINRSYPSIVFWSLLTLINLFLVWLMMQFASPRLQTYGYTLMAAIVILLLGAVCISEWGRRMMRKYSYDTPLKEWVELRIKYLDKGIKRSKNWFWRIGFGVIVLLIFCLIYILTVNFSLVNLLIQLITGLSALIIASAIANKILMKRMVETRKQLQVLYDQLQDSE